MISFFVTSSFISGDLLIPKISFFVSDTISFISLIFSFSSSLISFKSGLFVIVKTSSCFSCFFTFSTFFSCFSFFTTVFLASSFERFMYSYFLGSFFSRLNSILSSYCFFIKENPRSVIYPTEKIS